MQRELLDLRMFAAAADKTEDDVSTGPQFERGVEQRIEWMTRAVIARVHHDKAIDQSMLFAKCFPALARKTNNIIA